MHNEHQSEPRKRPDMIDNQYSRKHGWFSLTYPTPTEEILAAALRAVEDNDASTVNRAYEALRKRGARAESHHMRRLLHVMGAILPSGSQKGNQKARTRGWTSLYAPAPTADILNAIDEAASIQDSKTLHSAVGALKFRHKTGQARIARAITTIVDADIFIAEAAAEAAATLQHKLSPTKSDTKPQ